MLLDNKVCIITGAASARVIGRVTAKLSAQHGAKVAILDLDASQAEEAARSLGEGHLGLACNVTDKAAYVSRKAVPPADLPQAIRQIHAALSALHNGTVQAPAPELPTRSAIAASIRYNRLVSFIDGNAYKSLERHLTAHKMTLGEYRSGYGLSSDYPMVTPSYTRFCSCITREIQARFEAAWG